MSDSSIAGNSLAVRLWNRTTSVVRTASESSTAVRIGTLFVQSNAPPDDADVDARRGPTDVGGAGSDNSSARGRAEADTTDTVGGSVIRSSRLYGVSGGPKQVLSNSVTYRLLTGRDEPREIVLDLRKPAIVATTRRYALHSYRTVRGLSPTSGVAGLSYRLWLRLREQPVRLVSIAVLAVSLFVLVGQATAGTELGASTLVWIGVFLLAARGTQKRQSIDEITAIR